MSNEPPHVFSSLPPSSSGFTQTQDSHLIHNIELFPNEPSFYFHAEKSEKPSLETVSTLKRNEFALFYREPAQRSLVIVNCFEVNEEKITFLCPFCTRPSGGPVIHEHTNYHGNRQCQDHGTREMRCVTHGKYCLPQQYYAGFWLFVTTTTVGVNQTAATTSSSSKPKKKRPLTNAEIQYQKEFVFMAWKRKHDPTPVVVTVPPPPPPPTIVQLPPAIPTDFSLAIPDTLNNEGDDDEPDLIDILADAFGAAEEDEK